MTALLVLTHSLHVRNWVATGVVDRMVRSGHTVVEWRPCRHEPGRWRRWLRAGPLRTLSYADRARWRQDVPDRPGADFGGATYRHKLSLRRGFGPRIELGVALALARLASAERVAARIEGLIPVDSWVLREVERIAPDVVVIPTMIHTGEEVEFVKAARRLGIPTLCPIATWDTLVTKGGMLVRPDAITVWGERSARHARERHWFDDRDIFVTGPPQFDGYAAVPDDIKPHHVLVAGSTVAYWRDEAGLVEELRHRLPAAIPIVWRPHPRRPPDQVPTIPGVIMDPVWAAQTRFGGYPTTANSLEVTIDTVARAFCVVTAFSTMLIEAALCGRPSFVVTFGGSAIGHGGILEHAQYTHMRELIGTPGIAACSTIDEVVAGVGRCVETYAAPSAQLRIYANHVARCLDGQAGQRSIDAIIAVAQRGRRVHT